jgi:hypothetical protein
VHLLEEFEKKNYEADDRMSLADWMDLQPNIARSGENHSHIDTNYYKENKRMKNVFSPVHYFKVVMGGPTHQLFIWK